MPRFLQTHRAIERAVAAVVAMIGIHATTARAQIRAFPEAEGFGAVATGTAERLASFHRVENTYLSTFQALGGFGLLLGTVGLATVLMRNVLERRRELALLGAVG